ncbi:MAG: hypothetical protein ACR2QC_01570 [Gammaproteobacteria bacterium]
MTITPAPGELINITDEPGHARIGDGTVLSGHRIGLLPDNGEGEALGSTTLVLDTWVHLTGCDVTLPRAGNYVLVLTAYFEAILQAAPRGLFSVRTRFRNNTLASSYTTPEGGRYVVTSSNGSQNVSFLFYVFGEIIISVSGPDSVGMEVLAESPGSPPILMRNLRDIFARTFVSYVEVRS